jgi:hypothetical protein
MPARANERPQLPRSTSLEPGCGRSAAGSPVGKLHVDWVSALDEACSSGTRTLQSMGRHRRCAAWLGIDWLLTCRTAHRLGRGRAGLVRTQCPRSLGPEERAPRTPSEKSINSQLGSRSSNVSVSIRQTSRQSAAFDQSQSPAFSYLKRFCGQALEHLSHLGDIDRRGLTSDRIAPLKPLGKPP